MVVVAPTRKAAVVASDEIEAQVDTAAALAYQYGYRWDKAGVWSRLAIGDTDPETKHTYRGPRSDARLHEGDALVVDEAGMLGQETARALLTAADEAGARMVMVGDRRQLPAVGIGGVVDMAVKWAPAHVELTDVHRFRRLVPQSDGSSASVRDDEFADLSLASGPESNRARCSTGWSSVERFGCTTAKPTRWASWPGRSAGDTWTAPTRRCRWPPTRPRA